jgi:hypothetical protein
VVSTQGSMQNENKQSINECPYWNTNHRGEEILDARREDILDNYGTSGVAVIKQPFPMTVFKI